MQHRWARHARVAASIGLLVMVAAPAQVRAQTPDSPPGFDRIEANIDVYAVGAGQQTGAIGVYSGRAMADLDDAPSARALATPLDIGVVATILTFAGQVPYPLTAESLTPGGQADVSFDDASVDAGTVSARNAFSQAQTSKEPLSAKAFSTGQQSQLLDVGVGNYQAQAGLADDQAGTIGGDGIIAMNDVSILDVVSIDSVATRISVRSNGTLEGTSTTADTVVSGATVGGVPVNIGSGGISVQGSSVGDAVAASLTQQVGQALSEAGVLDIKTVDPVITTDAEGRSTVDAGGVRVLANPPPEASNLVNAAVPVFASIAGGRAVLYVVPGDGAAEYSPPAAPAGGTSLPTQVAHASAAPSSLPLGAPAPATGGPTPGTGVTPTRPVPVVAQLLSGFRDDGFWLGLLGSLGVMSLLSLLAVGRPVANPPGGLFAAAGALASANFAQQMRAPIAPERLQAAASRRNRNG